MVRSTTTSLKIPRHEDVLISSRKTCKGEGRGWKDGERGGGREGERGEGGRRVRGEESREGERVEGW